MKHSDKILITGSNGLVGSAILQHMRMEGYKNVITNQEFIPRGGWNDAPPGPTGELNTHTSPLYRKNYDAIRWNKEDDHEPSPQS